ncbi:MAG: fatty acid desaturase [Proteobacteria bacterium]|nr:fatty acid desaturase [Pseudomonadota bacterium]
MNAKYSSDIAIDWYRTPLDRADLTRLMQRSNLRGWLQTGLHLGLFFFTAFVCYQLYLTIDGSNWWWSVPALIAALFAHGTIGPFMGLIAIHELQHRTVFKSRALNEFFEKVYAFISWSDYLWYQQSHPLHHMATCHRAHDGEVVLPVKFSLKRFSVWLGLFAWNPSATWQRLKTTWRHANGKLQGDWYQYVLPESNARLRLKHRNWARTLLIGHALLAIAFILSGHWFAIVLFTFGTQYCGWLGFVCGIAQHYGMNPDIADFRYSTRTFTCSWLPAFYYWNMQYHLEHHMYPAVPFFNLPELRKTLEHDLPPAPHGLLATWREIMNIKNNIARDPHYRFVPAIPAGNGGPT